jgi:hypothetical protein
MVTVTNWSTNGKVEDDEVTPQLLPSCCSSMKDSQRIRKRLGIDRLEHERYSRIIAGLVHQPARELGMHYNSGLYYHSRVSQ